MQLAPAAPDPDAAYRWSLRDGPADSRVSVGDDAVIEVTPDVAGRYRFELDGPDGTATQTVRAFPNCNTAVELELPFEDVPDDVEEIDSVSVVGSFNDQLVGRDRPRRDTGRFVLDVELPPGEHHYGFCFNGDLGLQVHDSVTIPGPGRPRCGLETRIDSDDETDTLVVEADAAAAPDSEYADSDLAVEFVVDERDALPDAAIETDDRTLRVPVADLPERTRIHAVAVGERHSVADTVDVRRDGTGVTARQPNEPPAWAESPTVYEIFVRSFAGETLSATFAEIERRIEYLESLAVDVLWLTPILASPTDHGYHITDYFSTADDLGSRAAFESLVDRCHEADIRVVFDLVINHTSRDHPAFQLHSADVAGYDDYYARVPRERDGTGIDWAGEDAPEFYFNWERIPNLNYRSLDVRDWMLAVVDEWADVVDGFRCDIAWGVPHSFWKEVRERVPEDFLMLDETIPRDPQFHEAEFQMHYDSTLHSTLREVGCGETPASTVFDALDDTRWQGFPDSAVHLRYVENHDETRYLDDCGEASLRAAAAATFTLPGAPMLYYGQERGMTSQRGPMKWHDGDSDLTEFHRSLAWLRRDQPVLRDGSVEPLDLRVVEITKESETGEKAVVDDDSDVYTDDDDANDADDTDDNADTDPATDDDDAATETAVDDEDDTAESDSSVTIEIDDDPDRVIGFARDNGDDRLLVVLNFSETAKTVALPTAVGDTDLRTDTPLRKRYDPDASDGDTAGDYVVVDDVLICRPA
ncbi:alpha-amylase [Halonotius terrestris]|uniref:Alpha-amylase n=1 Tax=Halonotius terrestris TaxID=2487750 RepID=A0A8J8TCU4_9EURY|nr:alpha-amylase [Halonotius terrestris]